MSRSLWRTRLRMPRRTLTDVTWLLMRVKDASICERYSSTPGSESSSTTSSVSNTGMLWLPVRSSVWVAVSMSFAARLSSTSK